MEETPTVAILTLALLTAPALAGGISPSPSDDESWLLDARFVDTGNQGGSEFGAALVLADTTAAVGAPGTGSVHILETDGAAWISSETLTGPSDFGRILVATEDTLAVAAPGASTVHLYERGGDEWSKDASWTGGATFGASLGLAGDAVAIASPAEGTIDIFHREAEGWSLDQVLGGPSDFGSSVAMDGSTLAVLSPPDGIVFFERSPEGWAETDRVTGFFPFDASLALEESTLAAASPFAESVTIVEKDGEWGQTGTLVPEDTSPFAVKERFGASVDVAENRVIVGAPGDDRSPDLASPPEEHVPCVSAGGVGACPPPTPGAAYLFSEEDDGWQQTSKLWVHDAGSADGAGTAVAITKDGSRAGMGAPWERAFVGPSSVDAEDAVYLYSQLPREGLSTGGSIQ